MENGGKGHSLADFCGFDAEENDLIRRFAEAAGDFEDLEDVNFVEG